MADIKSCLEASEVTVADKAALLEELVELVEDIDNARSECPKCKWGLHCDTAD